MLLISVKEDIKPLVLYKDTKRKPDFLFETDFHISMETDFANRPRYVGQISKLFIILNNTKSRCCPSMLNQRYNKMIT